MTMIYVDTAHAVQYYRSDDGTAIMRCRRCDRTFRADPSDTTSHVAPYDGAGDPWCGCGTDAL